MHNSSVMLYPALEHNSRPYVAGLDISLTSTGFYLKSIYGGGDDYFYHIATQKKGGTDAERVDFITQTVLEDLTSPLYPVIAVCMEDYGQVNPRAGKLMVRAEIVGCIKQGLRYAGIPYYTVSPNGLKKFATGFGGTRKGEKLKEAVMQAAANIGFDTRVSDEADAFWAANLMEAIVKNVQHGVDVQRVNPAGFTFNKKY